MSEHLSEFEVEGYVSRTLAPDILLRSDDHIVNCVECHRAVAAVSSVDKAALVDMLHQPDHDPHMDFDQMAAYVDGSLDGVGIEIAEHHLHECVPCREYVRDLETLRDDLANPALPSSAVEPASESLWDRIRQFGFPVFALPAVAMLLLGILFAGWYFGDRRREIETAGITPPNGNKRIDVPPATTDTLAEPGTESNAADEPKPLTGVNDGDGRIEVDAAGKVSGLGDPQYDSLIAGVLKGNGVKITPDLRRLRQSAGELMGEGRSGVPFALAAPTGTIVETTQPKLRWKPLKGADTYRVDVFDDGFNKVASSGPLKASEWQLDVPLRRGTVFRWQVTATVNGEEVKSPVRPAPDARFKVLDTAAANRIAAARTKHGRSHLLLGILYAEAGLIVDAEREFRALVQKNPDSAVARRLLEKVRSAR